MASLRSRIVSGEVPPGTRLLEAEVAAEMGTSRGPVREAIRHLEQEGLVEFFTNRGAVVVGVPPTELAGVYELRAVIEARAFGVATRFVNQVDLEALTSIANRYDAANKAGDIELLADLDHQFHQYVLDLSGLIVLRRIWDGLQGLVRIGFYERVLRPEPSEAELVARGVTTHHDLLAALGMRDPSPARTSVIRHILYDEPFPI